MRPVTIALLAALLSFLAALSLYGIQVLTNTETLGASRLSVVGLAFMGCMALVLAVIAFIVSLAQKTSVGSSGH